MSEWTFFADLLALVEPPLIGAVDGMAGALTGSVAQLLRWGVTLYLAGYLLGQVLTPAASPLSEMERRLIRGAVAFAVATNLATYTTYVKGVALALPEQIAGLVTGAVSGAPPSGAAFDAVWNKAFVGGLAVYNTLGYTELALQLLVVIYWFVALFAIGGGFVLWVAAKVFLYLLLGLGPLFVGMLAFPLTQGWFQGRLNGVVTAVVGQVLVVALLVILTSAENELIGRIVTATSTAGAGAGIGQSSWTPAQILGEHLSSGQGMKAIQMLLGGVLLFGVCLPLLYQIPGIARGIGQGAAFHGAAAVSSIAGMATGAIGAATSMLAGAPGAAAAAVRTAGRITRQVRPAGVSLSQTPAGQT